MAARPSSLVQELASLLPTTTASAAETQRLGAHLASVLPPGAVLALYGDLGSGKTQLVKGLAKGLGLSPSAVRSPTYTILHTYEGGTRPLYHFDAYRVQTPDEFVELGFDEYVHDDEGVTCLEWADRVESLLPEDAIRLRLSHDGRHARRIVLVSPDPE